MAPFLSQRYLQIVDIDPVDIDSASVLMRSNASEANGGILLHDMNMLHSSLRLIYLTKLSLELKVIQTSTSCWALSISVRFFSQKDLISSGVTSFSRFIIGSNSLLGVLRFSFDVVQSVSLIASKLVVKSFSSFFLKFSISAAYFASS